MQVGDEKFILNYPKAGESLKICFYNNDPKKLADVHPVIQVKPALQLHSRGVIHLGVSQCGSGVRQAF